MKIRLNFVIVYVGIDTTCWHFKPWLILKIPNTNWQAHLEQCYRSPDTLKGPGAMLNQSCDPLHIRGSVHFCKLKNSRNSGELRSPREILPSIKTNYHVLICLQLHYWMTLILCYCVVFFDFFFEKYVSRIKQDKPGLSGNRTNLHYFELKTKSTTPFFN